MGKGELGRKKRKANFRLLAGMILELKQIKQELLPEDESDKKTAEEMKSFDGWQKQKFALNKLLKTIRDDTRKLEERKKEISGDERDKIVITLMQGNQKNLKNASALWGELKTQLTEDSLKRVKKIGEKELDDRKKHTELLGRELVDLSNKNSRVKGSGAQTAEQLAKDNNRAKTRTQQKRQERLDRQAKRAAKRKDRTKKDGHFELDDDDIIGTQMGQQEQQWMDQVEANREEQDEILDTILDGLTELKELSLDMNKTLVLQKNMITEIDSKMDQTIDNFKTVNGRLDDLLKKSGGLSRWCPSFILLIVILALAGYIYSMASSE